MRTSFSSRRQSGAIIPPASQKLNTLLRSIIPSINKQAAIFSHQLAQVKSISHASWIPDAIIDYGNHPEPAP